jgi:hypothetical protein
MPFSLPAGCHGGVDLRGSATAPADADLDRVHGGAGDLVDALLDPVREQTHLRRPRRVGDLDDEPSAVEADGLDVGGDGLADDLRPAPEHTTHRLRRASFTARPTLHGPHESVERLPQRQRVLLAPGRHLPAPTPQPMGV